MMLAPKARFLLAAGLLSALCAAPRAHGQTTGRIAGVVKDPSGAVIAGAEVSVTRQATGEERKVATDETGNYSVPLLPPGAYQVSIAARGFRRAFFPQVVVNLTETTAIDAVLAVGEVTESVTVTAAGPLVQTDGPQLGRVVDSRGVSELPLATRNITQILGLSPGTATYLPDNSAVGRNTQTISVNGARPTQNNFQINGVDANTMGTSSAGNVAVPAPESVQEFKVQTSLYDATFGRSGGGNIQVVTRSGTNAFHGTLYEYFRNDALNANNLFLKAAGVPRPALKRNVFGGALGGPLRREKAFFFVSYQGARERNAASLLNSVSSGVLIARGLTDDRSAATLLSTFPVAAIDPAALALLNIKLPNGQFLIPTPQANGQYTGASVSRFQEDQFNANVDYLTNARNALTVKAFFANAPSVPVLSSFRGGGPNVPGFGSSQENNIRLIVIQDTHTFTANVFNEARIGYNAHRNYAVSQEPVKDSDVGIRRANANALPGLPLIRIAPAAGGVIIGTQTNISPTIPSVATFVDTVWIRRGKHALRAGAEVRYNQAIFTSDAFTRGQIDFSSFNNFLVGATALSVFGSGIGRRNQRAFDYNFFFQDDWKVSPKWTLNLGMRYELDLPVYDTRGSLATFDPGLYRPRLATDNAGAPIGPPLGGFVQAGNVVPQFDSPDVPKVSKGLVKSVDPDNFGPRLGFAYSPLDSGRLVLRGGYGIFYSRPTFQYVSLSVTVPPTYILGRRAGKPVADPFFPTPSPGQFPTFVPGVSLSGPVLDRNIRTPYFQQYNLSVQYEWMKDLLLEVAYAGTRGLNLFRQVAINQARLASPQNPIRNEVTAAVITTNTTDNAKLRAPFQGVEINSFFQNQTTAQSTYNSLQVSVTQRVSRGLQFLASYTYAKSIDNGSGNGGGSGISGVVNPGAVADTSIGLGNQLNTRANRGVSDFDRTHRFVLSFLWALPAPAFADGALPRRLLSDWQLGGIITAMSGLPIDIVDTGAGSFYGLDRGSSPLARPNLVPGTTCQAARSNVPAGYFFNPFVFVRPVVQRGQVIPSSRGADVADSIGTDIGNVGRNCLRGPRQVNVDFSVARRVRLTESKNIQIRAEFFNLFNHPNLANPISDLNAVVSSGSLNVATGRIVNPGTFGRIISTASNPRLVQLAVRFRF